MSQKNYHTDNKSFIIYKEWEECVDELSDEDAGKLFKALFDFAARGEELKLKDCAKFTCMFMKRAIERDGKKWEKVCKARSDAAKAKQAQKENSAKTTKAAKATDKEKEKEKEKEKDKDNVYVYDKEKEKERSAPNNRTSKKKLLAEYSSRHKRGRGFERRGARSVQARILKARKVKYQLLASNTDPLVTIQYIKKLAEEYSSRGMKGKWV